VTPARRRRGGSGSARVSHERARVLDAHGLRRSPAARRQSGDAYSIVDWNGLTFDGDGSLVIHIHHCSRRRWPGANWLPAAPGRFNLLLRMHWPEQATPPTLTRVS